MKQEPIDEHAANEALPTKAERNYGVLTRRYRLGDRRNGNLLDFVSASAGRSRLALRHYLEHSATEEMLRRTLNQSG